MLSAGSAGCYTRRRRRPVAPATPTRATRAAAIGHRSSSPSSDGPPPPTGAAWSESSRPSAAGMVDVVVATSAEVVVDGAVAGVGARVVRVGRGRVVGDDAGGAAAV